MTRLRILTIILNYRTADMTMRAADAAVKAMAPLDAELVIVDNASGDGSLQALRDFVAARGWRHVRVVDAGQNGGFGAGNNAGMRAGRGDGARADYVYILNSDAFPAASAIRVLATHLESHPKVGIAGSYVHGPDDEAHLTAFRFPTAAGELEQAARTGPISRLLRRWRVPMDLPKVTQPVDWLAGASMMLRQDMLDQIGRFDEAFFLYFEETDLCLRAARAGWRCDYVPDSKVAHIGSVSTGMRKWARVPGYWFDSRLHYFAKNHGVSYAVLTNLARASGTLIWNLRRLLQRKPRLDPPGMLGDLLRHDLRAAGRGMARISRLAGPRDGKEERLP